MVRCSFLVADVSVKMKLHTEDRPADRRPMLDISEDGRGGVSSAWTTSKCFERAEYMTRGYVCRNTGDPEDPTPLIDQVYLRCTQRAAKVGEQVSSPKTRCSKYERRLEGLKRHIRRMKNVRQKRSLFGAGTRKAMLRSFLRDTAKLARKDISSFQQVATPCLDDLPRTP